MMTFYIYTAIENLDPELIQYQTIRMYGYVQNSDGSSGNG